MEWKSRFEIGIPEIDKQHMIIVECITSLEQAVGKRAGKAGWSAIHSVLGQLSAYVRMHFASEEALMHQYGYPGIREHSDEHLQFMHDLSMLQQKSMTRDIAHELLDFLDGWWHEHIMERDKQYVPFLPTPSTKAGL